LVPPVVGPEVGEIAVTTGADGEGGGVGGTTDVVTASIMTPIELQLGRVIYYSCVYTERAQPRPLPYEDQSANLLPPNEERFLEDLQ